MHWDFALILILLAGAVPLLGRRRMHRLTELPDTSKIERLVLYASTIAFQCLAAGLILWRTSAHGIHPSSLGLTFPRPELSVTITVVVCSLLAANQIVSINRLASTPSELKGAIVQIALKVFPRDAVERLAFFALVATVAVCEEIIYRGFAQLAFEDWSRSTLIGVLASAFLFSLAHLYQGRRGLVSTFTIGILFAGIRAWTGSLVPTMAAHFVTDLTAGFVAPSRIPAALSAESVTHLESESTKASHATRGL